MADALAWVFHLQIEFCASHDALMCFGYDAIFCCMTGTWNLTKLKVTNPHEGTLNLGSCSIRRKQGLWNLEFSRKWSSHMTNPPITSAARFSILPCCSLFCHEILYFADRFLLLPWYSLFCCEVLYFAVTLILPWYSLFRCDTFGPL